MTLKQATKIKNGSKLKWTDPDDGSCTGAFTVKNAEVHGDFVKIEKESGDSLDAFPHELELV